MNSHEAFFDSAYTEPLYAFSNRSRSIALRKLLLSTGASRWTRSRPATNVERIGAVPMPSEWIPLRITLGGSGQGEMRAVTLAS
jgi:hypothetical protein